MMTTLLSMLLAAMFSFATVLPAQAAETGMTGTVKPAGQLAHGEGIIKALDAKAGMVTLSHGPVQELNWPAMTMAFKLAKPELAKGLAVGKKVKFAFQAQGMSAVITSIKIIG